MLTPRQQDAHFLVVDDHALLREGVVSAIRALVPDAKITQAGSLQDAIQALGPAQTGASNHAASITGPMTVILDLQLPDSTGLPTLQSMRHAAPRARIAIVSAHNEWDLALACIQDGACAFVPKQGTLIEFQQALSVIAAGGVYFPRELFVSAGLPAQPPDGACTSNLTPRQQEVLALLLDGLSNASIAEQLGISEETVKLHVRAILREHGVANRVHLLLCVARHAAPPSA